MLKGKTIPLNNDSADKMARDLADKAMISSAKGILKIGDKKKPTREERRIYADLARKLNNYIEELVNEAFGVLERYVGYKEQQEAALEAIDARYKKYLRDEIEDFDFEVCQYLFIQRFGERLQSGNSLLNTKLQAKNEKNKPKLLVPKLIVPKR